MSGLRIDVLNCLMKLFSLEPQIKHTFREAQGFVYVMSIFTTMSALMNESSAGN